jgi:hypothetical protein
LEKEKKQSEILFRKASVTLFSLQLDEHGPSGGACMEELILVAIALY